MYSSIQKYHTGYINEHNQRLFWWNNSFLHHPLLQNTQMKCGAALWVWRSAACLYVITRFHRFLNKKQWRNLASYIKSNDAISSNQMKIYISPPHTNRADDIYIRHAMAMCVPSVGSCINVIFLRSCQSSVILKALQWTSQWELSGPCTGGHSPALSAGCCACYNGAQTEPLSDHITPPGIGIHFMDLTGSGAAAVGAYNS